MGNNDIVWGVNIKKKKIKIKWIYFRRRKKRRVSVDIIYFWKRWWLSTIRVVIIRVCLRERVYWSDYDVRLSSYGVDGDPSTSFYIISMSTSCVQVRGDHDEKRWGGRPSTVKKIPTRRYVEKNIKRNT